MDPERGEFQEHRWPQLLIISYVYSWSTISQPLHLCKKKKKKKPLRRQNYHSQIIGENTEAKSREATFLRPHSLWRVESNLNPNLSEPRACALSHSPLLKEWAVFWECLRTQHPIVSLPHYHITNPATNLLGIISSLCL